MFGIGGTELIVIAVVALLLFGPDKLPQFGRTIGRFLRDFKRYQDIMEATIRAEMYASEDTKLDPFKKGKDFREKVQAERAAAEKAEAGLAENPEELSTPGGSEESQQPETDEGSAPEQTPTDSDADGEGERSASDED